MRRATPSSSAAAKRLAVFLAVAGSILAAVACRGEKALPGPPTGTEPLSPPPVTAPPSVDRDLDDLFAFAAGLPGESPSFAAWRQEAAWKEFSGAADKAWKDFDSTVLERMGAWAADDLSAVRERTETLFYPFGGPDFATAFTLFPGAKATVLIGLEPAGNLPDFGRMSVEGRAGFFADVGSLTLDFLTRGYFVTMHMMDTYSQRNLDGALPVIGFFLKRGGYSVVDVRRLAPDDGSGGWAETPYARLEKRPHRPYGVRIEYLKPGDAVLRTVYYFSCDIANKSFPEDSPLHRFFEGLEHMTTFVKAGSYLLHWSDFSTLRTLILDRSLFVLEDDTAVPYRFFKNGGWGVTLFGRYATPVKDFKNVEQPDLREAYEDPAGNVQPLPFHFGYRWRTQVDNLLLAERPRRPYKVPVVK
jgi:hypothetical protein